MVEAKCHNVDHKGDEVPGSHRRKYWILSENGFGKRKARSVGRDLISAQALYQEAAVRSWLKGGPLPELINVPESPKKSAELIVFPGGTNDGDAA